EAVIAAVTNGIKSFTLSPYLFTELHNLRELAHMPEGAANYWVADLKSPDCAGDVARWVRQDPSLEARTTGEFAASSERYWVWGSGAGVIIMFGTLLGLFVGSVIVAQTLHALSKQYARELATLKAIGGTSRELFGFVGWQALFMLAAG